MSIISGSDLVGGPQQPHTEPLHCPGCGSGRHLTIHSIDSVPLSAEGLVTVTYGCEKCGDLHTEEASVSQVAAVLNRPGPSSAADVLQFGGQYIHCGAPMHAAGSQLRSTYSLVPPKTAAAGLLQVYLNTRVLRCDCGFQMEIPT